MKKRGISLIVLVITIIIIIILAGAVILNLNNNNPVDQARLSNIHSTRDSLKSGINLYTAKIIVQENGNYKSSTMILGKNTNVIDYSIVHDYSLYATIRENLDIWQLDYQAIYDKVNLKLDFYDNNSRWFIDEFGNPFLVYNNIQNVPSYLKNGAGTDIHPGVKDFVVVLENIEFAENSDLVKINSDRNTIRGTINRYLESSEASLSEISDSSDVKITVNGTEKELYKLNLTSLNIKTGTNLSDKYENADWYVDENGNLYLIYDEETSIPEEIKNGVSSNSYITINGGVITAYISSNVNDNPTETPTDNEASTEPTIQENVLNIAQDMYSKGMTPEEYGFTIVEKTNIDSTRYSFSLNDTELKLGGGHGSGRANYNIIFRINSTSLSLQPKKNVQVIFSLRSYTKNGGKSTVKGGVTVYYTDGTSTAEETDVHAGGSDNTYNTYTLNVPIPDGKNVDYIDLNITGYDADYTDSVGYITNIILE